MVKAVTSAGPQQPSITVKARTRDGRALNEGWIASHRYPMLDARTHVPPRRNCSFTAPRATSSNIPSSLLMGAGAADAAVEPVEERRKAKHKRAKDIDRVSPSLKKLPLRVFVNGRTNELKRMFGSLVSDGQLESALFMMRQLVQANRTDVLENIYQKQFMKKASQRRAAKEAMEFVELLPDSAVDCRTYNMLASVCIRAQDVQNALVAAKLMQKRGLKMDLPMYTNLIIVHGSCGDVNAAFHMYTEMKDHGLVPDCTVAGALATVCATKLRSSKKGDRRGNLVLLERASNLLRDLKQFGIPPDTTLWNVLVTCAGRAGQLQRAFDLLQQMQERHCQADSVTYGSLINGCVKAQRRDLALKIYDLAINELSHPLVSLYTVALEACMCGLDPVDSDRAFEIYRQAERSGRPLDVHFFSTMIRVAGKAGMPDLALSVEDNMRVQGIAQSTVTCSALISASLASKDLQLAAKIYSSMMSKGIFPNLHQFTNLMQAYARVHRFGDVVNLVEDMIMQDITPDDVMSDILLSCFKDSEMADLAFAVFTLLRGKGVPLTERMCYSMLDICHIQIKALRGVKWSRPDRHIVSTAEGMALLHALSKGKNIPAVQSAPVAVWIDRSISIYKSALASGVMPSLKLLAKLLSCLRIPRQACEAHAVNTELMSFNPYEDIDPHYSFTCQPMPRSEPESCFDKRVMQLIKEAISAELIQPFCVDSQRETKIGYMPPAVAEAYVFTMMEMVKFHYRERAYYPYEILLKTHPFDPKKALVPSAAWRQKQNDHAPPESEPFTATKVEDDSYGESTSLAVIALLRRLRLWHNTDQRRGLIFICPRDITNWMHAEQMEKESTSEDEEKYKSLFSAKLATQQRDIRIMHEQEISDPSDSF